MLGRASSWSGSRTNERAGRLKRSGFEASFFHWSDYRTNRRRRGSIRPRSTRPFVRWSGSRTGCASKAPVKPRIGSCESWEHANDRPIEGGDVRRTPCAASGRNIDWRASALASAFGRSRPRQPLRINSSCVSSEGSWSACRSPSSERGALSSVSSWAFEPTQPVTRSEIAHSCSSSTASGRDFTRAYGGEPRSASYRGRPTGMGRGDHRSPSDALARPRRS